MALNEKGDGEPLRFMLIDRTPGSDLKFLIQSPDEHTHNIWITQINSLLKMQVDFLMGK